MDPINQPTGHQLEDIEIFCSGRKYLAEVFPCGTRLPQEVGLCIYTRRTETADGRWLHEPFFLVETTDLSTLLPGNPLHDALCGEGANALAVCYEPDQAVRLQLARDLIAEQQPIFNWNGAAGHPFGDQRVRPWKTLPAKPLNQGVPVAVARAAAPMQPAYCPR